MLQDFLPLQRSPGIPTTSREVPMAFASRVSSGGVAVSGVSPSWGDPTFQTTTGLDSGDTPGLDCDHKGAAAHNKTARARTDTGARCFRTYGTKISYDLGYPLEYPMAHLLSHLPQEYR